MAKLTFSQEMQDALFLAYEDPDIHRVIKGKIHALYLLSNGLKRKDVENICRISQRTLAGYIAEYRTKTLEELCAVKYKGSSSELYDHTEKMRKYFTEHPPHSVKEAQAVVKEQTGIQRSPSQARIFLHTLGFRPLRTGLLPAKADPEAQEDFKKNFWSLV